MPAGYWAFLHIANFCQYGTDGNLTQFIEPNTKYRSTFHTLDKETDE